ncbi:MAG: DUF3352 domain-containing protein [Gemmataceae bacterium]
MRFFRITCAVGVCWLLLGTGPARAETPVDPLRLIPEQADLFLKIEKPQQLVEAVTGLELFQQLQQFAAVRELYDSTNARRFYQLVDYFEKELGADWPELLDRLAGDGAVLASKIGPEPAPVLFVARAKDEKLLRQFVAVALKVVQDELERNETGQAIRKDSYRDLPVIHFGPNAHAATAGPFLLLSNNDKALQLGIDQYLDAKASLADVPAVAEARQLLPAAPLAWGWLNLEPLKQSPRAKEVLSLPRNDANLTVLFGSWLDVAARAPFLTTGLYKDKNGFLLTTRLPAARDSRTAETALHAPPAGEPGSLPLLQPKGVLVSSSYYFDVSKFWESRDQLLNEQQKQGLEQFDANSGRFLFGNRFSDFLTQAGPYQRFVVVHQATTGYDKQPNQPIPAFAFVVSLRQPEKFSKSMEAVLRGAALLAGNQFKLKLNEEKRGDVNLVGYRFPEDELVRNDPTNIRYNFSPCFATVGDQFFVASTIELGRELIGLLEQEAQAGRKGSPATGQTRIHASGGADLLQASKSQLLAQTILDQALNLNEAEKEVDHFIQVIRRLGMLQLESHHGDKAFRYEVRLSVK